MTPQSHPNAGQELAQAKGLGDVVISAGLQANDFVNLTAAGGQQNNRRIGFLV